MQQNLPVSGCVSITLSYNVGHYICFCKTFSYNISILISTTCIYTIKIMYNIYIDNDCQKDLEMVRQMKTKLQND